LRSARHWYLQWGADGKVRQLDQLHPRLKQEERAPGPTGMIQTSVEQLDLATVIKVSQALSGEMVLEKLIDRLMRAALEHAGAERSILISPRAEELQIEAEATAREDEVTVHVGTGGARLAVTLPESLIRYVTRTRETVLLDDASSHNLFSADPYVVQCRARSILCLPLINQGNLIGILYLENNLTPRVFTSERIAVLKVLASQAAISLENSRLYRDLGDREAKIRRLVDANIIGICVSDHEGRLIEANDAFLRIIGYHRDDLLTRSLSWAELTPPEWRERSDRARDELSSTGTTQPFEKEYFRKDGSRVPVLVGQARIRESGSGAVVFVVDLTQRKRAEEALRQLEADFAHMNRVSMMGELAASLAHEITQPIASAGINARAAQNFLDMQPPDSKGIREALACVVDDVDRTGDIIDRIRDQIKKAPPRKELFDLNAAINEMIVLARSVIIRNAVSVQTRLADSLFPVHGDRVQLQQVVLNLILNAVEAMGSVEAGARELLISTEQDDTGVRVAVRDSGPGIDPTHLERVFGAFYTTKSGGVGMGLSICRSVIDAHGGRLWANANEPRGALFQFTLPGAESKHELLKAF
jgi:PAS domain S-box-containing protein